MSDVRAASAESPAARRSIELGRYTTPDGERVLYGQWVNAAVCITDRPADGCGRKFVIEQEFHEEDFGALRALVLDYLEQAAAHKQIRVTLPLLDPMCPD
jgi:hypothetical protein